MANDTNKKQSFAMEILQDVNKARHNAVILNYILSVCLIIALMIIIIK